jgi:hypothetical protein
MTTRVDELRAVLTSRAAETQGDVTAARGRLAEAEREALVSIAALNAHDAAVAAMGSGTMPSTQAGAALPGRAPRRSMPDEIEKTLRASPTPMTVSDLVKAIDGLRVAPATAALTKLHSEGKAVERDSRWTVPAG